ncbi:MAG: hypothetical protein H8D23_08210 [Candidatus Brocadiales bacterium]|nr:hypothetical protein [Candidatus Brocadiales bacterium]
MLRSYFKEIDKIQEESAKKSVLDGINLKELIANPREHLTMLGSKFIFDNTVLLEKGVKEGAKLSKKL